jgi:hypothetical protein
VRLWNHLVLNEVLQNATILIFGCFMNSFFLYTPWSFQLPFSCYPHLSSFLAVLQTPFGLLIRLLFTISHVCNYNHNYLIHFCAFTQLQSLHANIPFYSLTVFITHLTSWHVHTSRVCLLYTYHFFPFPFSLNNAVNPFQMWTGICFLCFHCIS